MTYSREPAPVKAVHSPRLASGLAPVLLDAELLADDAVLQACTGRADWGSTQAEVVELAGVRVAGGTLASSRWRRGGWVDVDAEGADLANASFQECGWRRVRLHDCRATGLQLPAGVIQDLDVSSCRFDLVNLRFAKLTRARFTDCKLTGTDFQGATLTDVVFDQCDLTEAHLDQVTIERVQFDRCILNGVSGLAGLRGAVIACDDVISLAGQLADALGIWLRLGG